MKQAGRWRSCARRCVGHYLDDLAGALAGAGFAALTIREHLWRNALITSASLARGQRVLDVGCGTGTLLINAKQREPSLVVHGIDGDRGILERARKKAQGAGATIEFRTGMSFALPYPDGCFDLVLSSLFFHHLTTEAKRQTFGEMYRVTRTGGGIHIADWGVPQNALMRTLYLCIQLLDGFETTGDNARGLLPVLMEQCGFVNVQLVAQVATLFGTLAVHSGVKAAHG